MSHFTQIKTKFQDGKIIEKLLVEMGYKVVEHGIPVLISGYGGKTETANMVVTKDQFGGYGDLRYRKEGEVFTEVCDAMDRTKIFRPCGGYSKFKQNYALDVAETQHNRIPGAVSTVTNRLKDGRVELVTVAYVDN